MKEKIKAICGRLLRGDSRRRLLLVLGLVGIALLALPEFLPRRTEQQTASPTVTATQVEQALEQRIADLISQVDGVDSCRVMVTLESTAHTVYAADTSLVTAVGEGEESHSSQESVLVVETDDGPVGLPVTQLQPTVKGVAVVCRGGDDPAVSQRIVELIATAFHISDRRVCVVGQK